MIDAETCDFVGRIILMRGVSGQLAIEMRLNAIDAENRNVLQKRGDENVIHRAFALQRPEAPGRRRAQDGPAPVTLVVHTVALQAPIRAECGCALQPERDERLAQVCALALAGIQRGIGDAQQLGSHGRVPADRCRDLRDVGLRIPCQGDDLLRYCRRTREIRGRS